MLAGPHPRQLSLGAYAPRSGRRRWPPAAGLWHNQRFSSNARLQRMTMLDRMRRHKNWLKWSLAIVVVAFVALYIPSFMQNPNLDGASPYGVVANVEGREITVARFRRVYQQQIQAYRNAYGDSMSDSLLRQLGIDQRIVQQLIEEEAALAEAERQGISASDAEVRARILALPMFQENGHFIGDERYRQYLQNFNPPLRPGEFEDEIRRNVTLEKLQGALTDWITVADADVTAEFNRRNEKVKLAVVAFPADKFKEGVTVGDADVASHFEANKEKYRIPEKRKIKYALIDLQGIRQRTTVSTQDAQRYYDENQQQYSTPEQVRVSHILLKTEGKDDAAVKKQAEDVLAKVKGGADFAALATKISEDETSATKGGELDAFGKGGGMVKEFEDAAFALKPGETSDLVKSPYGYHIIRLLEKKPAATRSLDESRVQIDELIKSERAQKEADRISSELAGKLTKPGDLDTVAKGRGLTVGETGFFARAEPIAGLGMAPAIGTRAFEMKAGEVSEAVRSQNGLAFITVTGTQESRLPSLDEVKARVREDVTTTKAVEAARQKATTLAAQLKTGDFTVGAKAAGLEAKTTELIVRGAPIPDVGVSAAVDAAAFALPQGGVSEPIVTETGAVIVKVIEKQSPSADELKTGRDTVKRELLNQQKQRFYASYMTKARERMNIRSNPQVIAQVVG
jgi:peptidyl-prolyl cis-trans isomerase D